MSSPLHKQLRISGCVLTLLLALSALIPAQTWAQAPDEEEAEAQEERAPEALLNYGSVDPQEGDVEPERHVWRTAAMEALAIGAGTAWYWIDRERQVADWDFPSLSERLTLDVIRYDNNPHHVNFAWHAGNGCSFHYMARANGLGIYESVGVGLLTSLTWEYALEYREKVSFNDVIFTTGVGLPLGEFIHVMGRYFNEDPEASEWTVARATLGAPIALMNAIDGKNGINLAAARTLWHRFRIGYSLANTETERVDDSDRFLLHSFHMDARFVRMPGFREGGSYSTWFRKANFTEARFDASFADGGSGFKLFADTTLFGYYQQRMAGEIEGGLSNSSMLGLSMAYRYRREQVGLLDDRVGVFHMPGLAADGYLGGDNWGWETRLRAHPDFVGVNALANDDWNAAHEEQGKAILRKAGYYYGFGASLNLSTELRFSHFGLGASYHLAKYYSDEGLDRTQEDVEIDQKGNDRIDHAEISFEWQAGDHLSALPAGWLLRAEFTDRRRTSVLEEFEQKMRYQRALVLVAKEL